MTTVAPFKEGTVSGSLQRGRHPKNVLFYLKISEWLGSISVTRVLETTLADHKWTDGGVKSDVSTPIQGSSSVMNDYKTRQGWMGVETSDLTSPSVHL